MNRNTPWLFVFGLSESVCATPTVRPRAISRGCSFSLSTNYRVTATWVPADGKRIIKIPNVLGDVTAQPVPGVVEFQLNGEELKLTALGGDAKNGLFFVFNDLTPKNDTYPGGRFLDTGPIVNGHVELDFNCAYNPPCAVTPYATCSLAPKENRLAIAIPAGEKFDKTAHAHTKPHRSLLNRCSLATINAWERRSGSAPGDGEFSNTSGSP